MQCSLFQSLLSQAVESRIDSISDEVCSHGATCSHTSCQAAWEDYTLLSSAISQWKSGLPQVDLTDRIMRELLPASVCVAEAPAVGQTSITLKNYFEQSWHDFQAPQQRPWAAAVLVAGVLLLIGTMIVSLPHAPEAEIAVRQRSNPAIGESTPQLAAHTDATANVAVATVEWAQKASSMMANAIVSIPERSSRLVPDESWDMDWKHRLEPLRRDAHAAWDKLLELPMKKDEG